MTPDFLSRPTPAAVLAALPGARAVGGAVRDHLAGRPIRDVDVAAPFPPDVIAARLRAAGLRVFETGLSHGTVTALLDREGVEVTALRRDTSTDGRHAQVEWITDWAEDAARRDFTINAMSMGADGVLHDYFGGADDLRLGRVRFVGDAAARIAEDYLRALRFFRFRARYGLGAPDAAAVAAIRAAVPGLARLSHERVWMEVRRLLAAPDPRDALRLMEELGVLGAPIVLPELVPLDLARSAPVFAPDVPADPLLRIAALLPVGASSSAASAISLRMRMSDRERLTLLALAREAAVLPRSADAAAMIRHLLFELAQLRLDAVPVAQMMLLLREGRKHLPGHEEWRHVDFSAIRDAVAAAPVPVFPLHGREALSLGFAPGIEVGRVLSEVKLWWLRDGLRADHAACLAKLRELAQKAP